MRVEVSSLWAAVLYDHNDHSIMAVCLGATSEDAGRKARAYLKDCIMEDDEAVAEEITQAGLNDGDFSIGVAPVTEVYL